MGLRECLLSRSQADPDVGLSMGVQAAMSEMERLEQKGDATPEEMEQLAQELQSKMLLTTWRATRWEVIGVSADRLAGSRRSLTKSLGPRSRYRSGAIRTWYLQGCQFETGQGDLDDWRDIQIGRSGRVG